MCQRDNYIIQQIGDHKQAKTTKKKHGKKKN